VPPAVRVLLAFAICTHVGDQVPTVVWWVGDAIDVGI
jgi:hypothetical protein